MEERDILQSINIIIGKILLSLFYYKDIILDKRNLNSNSATKRSTRVVLQKLQNQLKYNVLVKDNKNTIKSDLKQQENLLVKDHYLEGYNKQINNIETADQKLFKTYLESAKNGDSLAQWNLARCYHYGRGINNDYKKAFEWYFKSAN